MKLSIVLLLFIPLALATDGICAIYDTCGKKSIFGSALPCNSIDVPAQVPSSEDILLLQKVCGKDFPVDRVCCSPPQIKALESNLKKVDALIASCPACKKNFYDFFCDFSCSPNQSNFVKVTKTGISSDTHEEIVTEISQFVDYSYAKEFFNSCKNLKFLATNGFAMDLIGGGATNARDFLKFLGDEKPMLGGSPFQINFQYEEEDHYSLRGGDPKSCDDPEYKCACSDCSQSCPKLPHFRDFSKSCKVGPFPCFSFMILMLLLIAIVIGAGYHLYLRKQRKQQDVVDLHPTLIYPSRRRSSSSVSYVNVSSLSSFVSNTLNEINSKIEEYFQEISYACSSSPWPTIIITLFITFILCTGLRYLEFETDPVNLWVSPTEPALLEKQFFESKFGKFYRIEQLIVSSSGDNSSVLDWDVVQWWFEREKELQSLGGQELSSLCFKPLGETCAIESFAQYFQGDINYLNENNWETKLKSCTDSPVNCLPTFQQPLKKDLLFSGEENVLDSRAFVVTILLNNLELTEHSAIKYELSFIDWVETIVKPTGTKLGLNVDYLTESSLETELNKSTNTDINTIAISYLIMFIYASLALGGLQQKFTNFQQFFVDTRFQLGLSGIVIILLSVFASAGIFSFFGIKSTLIIVEVIPFLVLAVGIDNIFLIVNELQSVSQNPEYQSVILEKRVSLAVKKVGPSCLILAILQFSMFLIASNVDMPAVKNFALYSSGAILLNFILQMTTFIALLTIDQRRKEEGKMDIFWVRVKLISLPSDNTVTSSSNTDNTDILQESENWITAFISKTYAPFILDLPNKRKILSFFILLSGISLSLVPNISYGLDQRIALPADSHLVDYFNSVYSYLNVGPPIFFVTKNLDVTERSNQQRVCGKFSTCNEYSISNILQQEYKRGKKSTIAEPASVWIDDFLNWLNPDLDQCCRFKKTTIGDDKPEFCSVFAPDRQCQTCYENHSPPYSTDMRSFPEGDDFMFYFNQWIEQPSDPCPLGARHLTQAVFR